MSDHYQIASLIPAGRPAGPGIRLCHRILGEEGIEVADDSLLALHDTDVAEPEPEPVTDAASALAQVIAWPALGTIDYAGPEGIVTVSYLGPLGAGLLTCVMVSAQELAVERTGSVPRYVRLGTRLHEELGATRTVLAYALETRGFGYEAEIERLRTGEFAGGYPLLDLRGVQPGGE